MADAEKVALAVAEITKLYGGEPLAYWFQTLILIIGAIGAFLAVWSARVIERRKAASAVIFQARADGALVDGLRRIRNCTTVKRTSANSPKKKIETQRNQKQLGMF